MKRRGANTGRWRRICALAVVFAILFSDAAPLFSPNSFAAAEQVSGVNPESTGHVHSEACYEDVLICGQQETNAKFVNNFEVHRHTDACRDSAGEIVCGYIENLYYHTHNEFCRDADGNLACGLETSRPHEHSANCYRTDRILVCENSDPGHQHTDACYQERIELTCGLPESEPTVDPETDQPMEGHHHSEACYTVFRDLICGQEERPAHVHGDACYQEITTLICDTPAGKHRHTADCFDGQGHCVCGNVEVPEFVCSEKNWKPGHTHTAECYERRLICGLEETIGEEQPAAEAQDRTNPDAMAEADPEEDPAEEKNDNGTQEQSEAAAGNAAQEAPAEAILASESELTEAQDPSETQDPTEKQEIPDREGVSVSNDPSEKNAPSQDDIQTENSVPQDATVQQPDPEKENDPDPETDPVVIIEEEESDLEEEPEIDIEEVEVLLPDDPEPILAENPDADVSENPEQKPDDEPSNQDSTGEPEENPGPEDTRDAAQEPISDPAEEDTDALNRDPGEETPEDFTEFSAEEANEESNEISSEKSTVDAEELTEENIEASAEESTDNPAETPAKESTDNPAEIPAEEISYDPAAMPAEKLTEDASEMPAEEEADEAAEIPSKEASEEMEEEAAGETEESLDSESADAMATEAAEWTISTGEDDPIRVSIIYSLQAAIPEGTEILVSDPADVTPKKASRGAALKSMSKSTALSGAESDLPYADIPLTVWQAGEESPEIQLYHRSLNISLAVDGEEIEPEAAVTVSVTLPDLEAGLDVTVKHQTEDGLVTLDSITEGQTVTFTTDGFSLFDFTSTAQKITSWTSDLLENTLFGRSKEENVDYSVIQIDENSVPDGFSILEAFSTTQSNNLWLMIQRIKDLVLGKLESIALYAVEDGKLAGLVKENIGITDVLRLSLGNYSSFALVRDSGLRRKIEDFGNVVLSGLMPKNGVVEAINVTEEYANFVGGRGRDKDGEADEDTTIEQGEAVGDKQREADDESHTIAAYDISITNDGEEYQPEENPVTVTIQDEAIQAAIAAGKTLSLWHVKDDGSKEQITDFTIDGNTVTFSASGFSVYVLTETIYTYYKTASGETYKISVEYDSTAKLPQNATLAVSEILPESPDYDTYVAQSINKLGVKEEALSLSRVFDIKIVDENGEEREPEAPVKVSIQLVGETLTDYASVDVVHFGEDKSVDEIDIDVAGDTVEFTTESFSVYLVGGTVRVRTYHFWILNEYREYTEYYMENGTDTPTNYQIIRSGDELVLPQTPTNPQDPEATFSGWFERVGGTVLDPTLADERYSFGTITFTATEDEDIDLHAKFTHYAYVIFHDQYDAESDSFPVAFTRRVDTQSLKEADHQVNVNQFSVAYQDPENVDDNKMKFVGWSSTPISVPGSEEDDLHHAVEQITTDSDGNIFVTQTIHLYPIFRTVKWISYYSGPSGSGATFIADSPYYDGIGPTSLPGKTAHNGYAVMKRDGKYTFAGWYAGLNDSDLVNGELPDDLTGYVRIADENGVLIPSATGTGISVTNVNAEGNEGDSYYINLTGNVRLYAAWTNTATGTYKIVVVKLKTEPDDPSAQNPTYSYEYVEDYIMNGEVGDQVDLNEATITACKSFGVISAYNTFHGTELTQNNYPYAGYTFNSARFTSDYSTAPTIAANNSTVVFVRYDWDTTGVPPTPYTGDFTLTWVNNLPSGYTANNWPTTTSAINGASLDDLATMPTCSIEGAYTFKGWFLDENCVTPVFFHEPSATELEPYQIKNVYDAATDKYIWDGHSYEYYSVMTAMPAANMTIYAGWDPAWYIVTLDPNYGALYTKDGNTFTGTGSTWFWASRDELIQEYYTIKRDYVESDSGSWYYVNHDKSGADSGLWASGERKTYYTLDPDEATEFTTFEYEPGAYRYAGWYEVLYDNNGNEIGESSQRYDFTQGITHNTTLRLRWMRVGAFYLSYNPVVTANGETLTGSMNHGDENEQLYLELDGDTYSDDADVVVTHVANPPEGYEFVGWRIRRDESGTIYRVGETFHLLSQYMATVQGRHTVFLDAVYEKIQTTTIVYHANGGTMIGNNNNLTDASMRDQVYGGYADTQFSSYASTLVREYYPEESIITPTEGTIVLGHIVNNGIITLSDHSKWLTAPSGATFKGWCENSVYDMDDTEHPLLNSTDRYRAGANAGDTDDDRIVHLYAIWAVNVNYHLNSSSEITANFGGDWTTVLDAQNNPVYTLNTDDPNDNYYTQTGVYLGNNLNWPPHDPICTSNNNVSFLGWSTSSDTTEPNYNFETPVTEPLDLYAVWGTAPTFNVTVVDSTEYATLVNDHHKIVPAPWVDSDYDDSNGADGITSIALTSEPQTPAALIAAVTSQAAGYNTAHGTTYDFTFAVVEQTSTAMWDIHEERIGQIYYSSQDGQIHLVYGSGSSARDEVLDQASQQLYFVYYQIRTPEIKYMLMELSGFVSEITNMSSNAPQSIATLADGGVVRPNEAITISASYNPMSWLDSTNVIRNERIDYTDYSTTPATSHVNNNLSIARNSITYYNFAIGSANAENSVQLNHKTQAYTGGETGTNARPEIKIKNTWRGLLFSQDGGVTWFDAGVDDPWLYIVFYTETPTVITVYNRTVGLPDDMGTFFDYDYWIEEIKYDSSGNITSEDLVFTTRNPDILTDPSSLTNADRYTVQLANGETFSAFTTTTNEHTYRITVVVKPEDNFSLTGKTITYVNGSEAQGSSPNTSLPSWVTSDARAAKYCYENNERDYTFSYTVMPNGPFCGKTALITFSNTRSAVNVDLHVAKADVNGTLYHAPEWRVAAADSSSTVWNANNAYTVSVPLGETVDLTTVKPYTIITTNVDLNYMPGALIYGMDRHASHQHNGTTDNDVITLDENASLACYRLAYEQVDEENSNIYNLYIKDGGDYRYPLTAMASQIVHDINGLTHPDDNTLFYRLFYLFYPAITVYYVVEDNDGSLTPIRGSTDDTTVSDAITYNGAQAVLNGVNVTQGQKLGIWERSLLISQDVGTDQNGNNIFNIPPLLDMWDAANDKLNKLNLIYYKLGASTQADPGTPHANISSLPGNKNNGYLDNNGNVYTSGVTEELVLQIGIHNHRLEWKFVDEPASQVLNNWPVVYAIYRERGYDLTITKQVTEDTGYEEPFPVTLTSKYISRSEYKVEGTGYNTIPATPAELDDSGNLVEDTGIITFSVKDGDSITIKGLSAGDDYVITEGGNTNYNLTASYIESHKENAVAQPINVSDSILDALTLDKNIEVTLKNEPKVICRIGTQTFLTLNDAIKYVDTNIGSLTATIEMLTDYLIPSSDALEIPTHMNITLTTANNYVGVNSTEGGNGKAVITRGFTNGAVFTNRGIFTVGDVILDGGYVSSSDSGFSRNSMFENDGTLNFGGSISVTNITETTTTDPNTQEVIKTTITTPANVSSSFPVVQNVKTAADGGVVYGWMGTVNVIGGNFTNCHAARGGVIYGANGIINVSGGTLQDNSATLGGAIYYAGSGAVNVSGGTIGASGHVNTASNGGAIYMASGTLNVSGGTIDYNQATGTYDSTSDEWNSGKGGAIYALNAYVNISGGSLANNTARLDGGAVNMETLTLTVSDSASIKNNSATSGNGGAIWSGTGSVVIEGGAVSGNNATSGNGGAVYTQSSAFVMTGGMLDQNTAAGNGGGVYAQSGSVTVEKQDGASVTPTISQNTAGNDSGNQGNGGGIYAASGAVTMTDAVLAKNEAKGNTPVYSVDSGLTTYEGGTGGALYVGSGIAALTGCTIGGGSDTTNANQAINGSAIFTHSGTVTLDGDAVTYNVATGDGGAIGVGTPNAKLIFSGNVQVQNNKKSDGTTSNVYLDQDTDTVINTNTDGIGSNAYIGIYVPTQNVKVAGDASDLVDRRGVPSAYFGSYVSGGNGGSNIDKFKNDRSTSLTVAKDTSGLKLYWSSNFKIEARYLSNFTNGMPAYSGNKFNGDIKVNEYDYNPPYSTNTSSDIAEDLRARYNSQLKNYIFAAAIALLNDNGTRTGTFDDYITEINWSIDENCWKFTTRKGTIMSSASVEKLVVYFSDAYYLTIENNTGAILTVNSLEGLVKYPGESAQNYHDLINRSDTLFTGYGYVYALDGAVQEILRPISVAAFDLQDTNLTLRTGDSITILVPGGRGMAYKLTGCFDQTYTTDNGNALSAFLNAPGAGSNTLSMDVTADIAFSLGIQNSGAIYTSANSKFPTTDGGKNAISQLIFGGEKTICRIVTDSEITGATLGNDYERYDVGQDNDPNDSNSETSGKYEYTFSTLKQAVSFLDRFDTSSNTIEMTKDYLIPSTDQVVLPSGKDITFSTSVTGVHRYNPESSDLDRRATISRDPKNGASFIVSTSGNLTDTLTVLNLILDGKEYSGGASGGVVSTKDWNVVIDNCEFKNCVAGDGGGIYVNYSPNNTTEKGGGSLAVTNTVFTNCKSQSSASRAGGGAIWTDTKNLMVTGCTFTNCFGTDQGGAVFHRIDTAKLNNHRYATDSVSTISNCTFTGCESRTGGGVETDAHSITITNCHFTDCYSVQTARGCGSGGAIASYIYEGNGKSLGSEYPNTNMTVSGCTFNHCTATVSNNNTSGHGGAVRSHSMKTKITDCTFNDCRSLRNGGAVAINNGTASEAEVNGCTFMDCSTSTMHGGAVYCDALNFTLGTATVEGNTIGTTIVNCTAYKDGGGIYHSGTDAALTATNLTIDRCTATATDANGGGGLYTNAKSVSITDSMIIGCTTKRRGGGVYVNKGNAVITIFNTSILSCTAVMDGGGFYANQNSGSLTITGCNSNTTGGVTTPGGITQNISSTGKGGGVYTNAPIIELKNSEVTKNQASGNGGGICQEYNSNNTAYGIIVDGSTVTDNISGSQGGGIYTGTNMTLKGLLVKSGDSSTIHSAVSITGNRLTTSNAQDAAGVYLRNGVQLFLSLSEGESNSNGNLNYAAITITGNKTVTGDASDLRIPDKSSSENDIKVRVNCGVQGEIRVVNAKKKLTQFGTMQNPSDEIARYGFTDEHKVFWSDDSELFGIIDRSDANFVRVIWGGDPICKITDANGRLLYLDANGNTPCVYDMLDDGNANGTSANSAFGTLRSGVTLYRYSPGSNSFVPYTGDEFIVKMLVENYSAEKAITLKKPAGKEQMTVTLTTARTTDELFKYRGREGTRCTILRDPLMDKTKAMMTFSNTNTDLTLQDIVLDGGVDNGVEVGSGTRIIDAPSINNVIDSKNRITLSRNATLQNASVNGNGGGVRLNSGAQLSIEGGAIRNCSATGDGGGVYIDGTKGAFSLSAGTVTYCTADGNGGGVYFNKGQLETSTPSGVTVYENGYINITGGSISRCEAGASGGGIYLNKDNTHTYYREKISRSLFMSGGNILYNHAGVSGGGIAVGDEYARITFSGAPYVFQNSCDNSVAAGEASNVQMDRSFSRIKNNPYKPGTIIVSRGLNRGATVGVYVPGTITDPDDNSSTLYDKHGAVRDPFATFEGTNGENGMNYFINDRNGMKGGRDAEHVDGDQRIYWRKIYSLTVTKKVLSDEATDTNKVYFFEIALTGRADSGSASDTAVIAPGTPAEEVNMWIGGIHFIGGKGSFGLHDGDTQIFDLLPLGFDYQITEKTTGNTDGYFNTSAMYYDTSGTPHRNKNVSGMTVNGKMNDANHFSYDVVFYNLHAVCKITDQNGNLLYRETNGEKLPAVYSVLVEAFNKVNGGDSSTWYIMDSDGVEKQVHPSQYRIEMLIDNYVLSSTEQDEYLTVQQNKNVVFTTAKSNSDDGFPYLGEKGAAKITLGYAGSNSMINVAGGSSLRLENITLDGGSFASSADGAIISVDNRARLTVGTGVTIQNAVTSGNGAGVYLAEGAVMNISGAPAFRNNVATGITLGENPTNGTAASFYSEGKTPQDIYIAGYTAADAESIVVTGDISSEKGSIAVWAANAPHYIQNQQFAVMSGGAWSGLDAFRNAKTDVMTQNPLRGDPKHLYGIAREGKVFWSGSMDLTVSKTVVGEIADTAVPFSFTVVITDPNTNNEPFTGSLDYARYEMRDGVWELMTPSLTGNPNQISEDTGSNGRYSFNLTNNQKIVISIPRGLDVTVTETENTAYTTSYRVDNASPVNEAIASNLAMNHDTTVAYTNTRKTRTVTVSKTLIDSQAVNSTAFNFTAMLKYNDAGIADYTMYSGIVTADGTGNDEAGLARFTLLPTNSSSASIVLTIPYGTNLTVTEDTGITIGDKTVEDVYDTSVTVNGEITTANSHTFTNVTENKTLAFTNSRKGANLTITKNVTGDMGDLTKAFTFTVTGLEDGESYSYTKQSTTDGTSWTNVENGTGTLQENGTFTLTHHQRIVIEELPLEREITFAESNENYTTTWATGDSTITLSGENSASATVTLSSNASITVTNNLNAVSPTGYSTRHTPFLLLLLIGILLLMSSGVAVKRRDKISDREPVNTGSPPPLWKAKHSKGDPIKTDAEEHVRWRNIRKRGDAG